MTQRGASYGGGVVTGLLAVGQELLSQFADNEVWECAMNFLINTPEFFPFLSLPVSPAFLTPHNAGGSCPV